MDNCQKCHFVHYSSFGKTLEGLDIWKIGTGFNVAEVQLNNGVIRVTDAALMKSDLCELGVFNCVFTSCGLDAFLQPMCDLRSPMAAVHSLREYIFGEFAGCADCNNKMTIAKYVRAVFELAFNPRGYTVSKNRGGLTSKDTHALVYYIMLSGVATAAMVDVATSKIITAPASPFLKQTWTLRFIMMWCALQILFCLWHVNSTPVDVRHHMDYLYTGVMDFYISLWYFALHCIKSGESDGDKVYFEEFHFYYTSCWPIFLATRGRYRGGASMNLSALVFGALLHDDASWSVAVDCATLQTQLVNIFKYVHAQWTASVSHLSQAIHNNFVGSDEAIVGFFISPDNIKPLRQRAEGIALKIKDFIALLSSDNYWFHFRHITFRRILHLCETYDRQLAGVSNTARDIRLQQWRAWVRQFTNRCRQLC